MNKKTDLKSGDKIRIVDASAFKPECHWLEGQVVEVVDVSLDVGCGEYIKAKHPKEPVLFLRPCHVEKVEK